MITITANAITFGIAPKEDRKGAGERGDELSSADDRTATQVLRKMNDLHDRPVTGLPG